MTTISAKIILDSISEEGKRLTTVHMRYPRFIHSELMTHRVFSRNARSSRAVPVKTMLLEAQNDPVVPLFWGKNQKGMQAGEPLDEEQIEQAKQLWGSARDEAVFFAAQLMDLGLHKQVPNRLLEPFVHIDTLVSSTEWANFFHLRDHKDAEPHIELLAQVTKVAMDESRPESVLPGQWHLPYVPHWERAEIVKAITGKDWDQAWDQDDYRAMAKISAARCARISYAPFDGNGSIEKEIERYDALITSQPVHASPVEHQATPDSKSLQRVQVQRGSSVDTWETSEEAENWNRPEQHGNFIGWRQNRKMIPGEAVW